jgi:hypothetical protein
MAPPPSRAKAPRAVQGTWTRGPWEAGGTPPAAAAGA